MGRRPGSGIEPVWFLDSSSRGWTERRGGRQRGDPRTRVPRGSDQRQTLPLQLLEQHWLLLVQAAPLALQVPPPPGLRNGCRSG